ncbi:hypothetical protein ASPZODRAFT_15295 [Penicilliopsis zonata CBS 506.65]|uniref:Phosphodiesterase n=1 Tax=Penicilliopsis zonata CBS 506.65 TaxID=1073090 RepID=A0A1L9SKZ1_9EURO|nr:hypothetical protein ASPZODRAFT_15295 [Penicilliopsis zonata CBS 506.65]OJJ47848.1 hypothetical protein ASPZODRAFT_15295 [Penicilliopsis zonata CBS 506.65]
MADAMDCSAVYIDDRVSSERWVRRIPPADQPVSSSWILPDEPEALYANVDRLLDVCKQIYLCHAGTSFATKLAELTDRAGNDCTPIFAFFDIDLSSDDSASSRRKLSRTSWSELDTAPPSPSAISLRRGFTFSSQSEEAYGLQLLSGVSADIQVRDGPNLIIPIAILRSPATNLARQTLEETDGDLDLDQQPKQHQQHRDILSAEPRHVSRCLDAGALDVLTSPLDRSRTHGLLVHAYRTRKTAQKELSRFMAKRKLRKQSWVGVHGEQPYAYLREAMVSKLMKGICNPEEVIEEFQERELDVIPERQAIVKEQIGRWAFTAHQFTEDELVYGACEMLQHALNMPELDHWRLTPGELRTFLLACRAAYNSFVLYHNFRHAVDVLQSVFCFLLHIGALPTYGDIKTPVPKSPIASLLSPFDALTLLIAAIGHDVGHPGVNNFFLVKLNAPLAQLYNDNSVLEAFHCAAYSQILRRHWPAAFKDNQLRKLLISSILATDMGVHQKFMERLGHLQEKYYANNKSLDGWKPQDLDQYRALVCGLLIKCADISNVSRPWDVAERWTKILQEEFANQGDMEKEVGMETTLFGGPPELGNMFKLATGQIGFMSIFALPLFEGVADLLPQLRFTVQQIRANQTVWRDFADREMQKQGLFVEAPTPGAVSPRTQSPVRTPSAAVNGQQRHEGTAARTNGGETLREIDEADDVTEGIVDDTSSSSSSPVFPRVSLGSVTRDVLNENALSPVVSPDTEGPSIDITGASLPVGGGGVQASRKSSSAVPLSEISLIPIADIPRDRNGSVQTQIRAADSPDYHSSDDSAVLAAVVLPDRPGPARPTSSSTDRPSSSRQGGPQGGGGSGGGGGAVTAVHQRHHTNTSSKHTTASNRHSCTRTQSVSTYSNPVMTPISPATNATSFLTVDSGDDRDATTSKSETEAPGDTGSSTRPSSSDAYGFVDHEDNHYHNGYNHHHHNHHHHHHHHHDHDHHQGDHNDIRQYSSSYSQSSSSQPHDPLDKGSLMATLVGNGGNDRRSCSPTHSTATSGSSHHHHHHHHHPHHPPYSHSHPQHLDPQQHHEVSPEHGGEHSLLRLAKRRSRLRLAFWKRKPHHSHQQEVSGDIH